MIGHAGEKCPFTAAMIIQAPIKLWRGPEHIDKHTYGAWRWACGLCLNGMIKPHIPILKDSMKESHNIDMERWLSEETPNIMHFDETFTANGFGHASL